MEKTLTFLLGTPPYFPLVCLDFALRPLGLISMANHLYAESAKGPCTELLNFN